MEGYLSNLLRRGGSRVSQPKRGVDRQEESGPLQPPCLPPVLRSSLQSDSVLGLSLRSEAGEHTDRTSMSQESLASAKDGSNQFLPEDNSTEQEETKERANHTSSDVSPGQSDFPSQQKQSDLRPEPLVYARAVGDTDSESGKNAGRVTSSQQSSGSQAQESQSPALAVPPQPTQAESTKAVVASVPERQHRGDQVGIMSSSRQSATNESQDILTTRSTAPLAGDSKITANSSSEKGKNFAAVFRLPQPSGRAQVQESQSPTLEISHGLAQEESTKTLISAVSERLRQRDQVRQIKPLHQRSGDEHHEVLPMRPPAPLMIAQEAPEISPAQTKEVLLQGVMSNPNASYREVRSPRITINRLDVQIINQTPAAPPQTPRLQAQTRALEAWETVDRHYLGRFCLNV